MAIGEEEAGIYSEGLGSVGTREMEYDIDGYWRRAGESEGRRQVYVKVCNNNDDGVQ